MPDLAPRKVDEFGAHAIIGAVSIPTDGDPLRVTLLVNEIEIDHVDVPPDGGEPARFRFPVKDMWAFCGPEDRITVRAGGHALRMPDGTFHHSTTSARAKPLSELKKRLRAGEIINSNGALALPKYLDVEWQRSATNAYRQVHDAVQEIAGYEPFLIYGSLLGAVREGRPLGHDLDLDSAYLSKETDPALVVAEAGRLAVALQERGFAVEARMTCIHVSDPQRRQRIDLYHLYFNEDDELRLAWGAVSDVPFLRSQWHGTEQVKFGGADVLIPRHAEDLVATLYGPNWRTPNPGFDWATERTVRAWEAAFPVELRPIINWQDFWSRTTFDSPSSFAGLMQRLPTRYPYVVDLGCGDGRDDPLFVRTGSRVLGLDRAPVALESARGRHLAVDRATFAACDFEQSDALRSALAFDDQERPQTLYYACQLLDSVTEEVQAGILQQLGDVMAPGDAVAFEFRGLKDRTLTAHERRSCGRRLVDADPVRDWIAAAGFTVDIDAASGRWESRGGKQVRLHRIVASKPI